MEIFKIGLKFIVGNDLATSEFNFRSIEKSRAGVDAGHDGIQFSKTFDNVDDDAMRKGHGNITGSDIGKTRGDEGFFDSGPGTAATFFEVGEALKNWFAATNGAGEFGDGFGISNRIFDRFGEVNFAKKSKIGIFSKIIGITVAINTNVAAVGFLGDKTIGARAKGTHSIVKGIGVDFEDNFVKSIGVVLHN